MNELPNLEHDVPLGPMTTLGIGGRARYFMRATDIDELARAVAWSRERSVPLFVLGGGSNIVVADSGFDGLVVRNELQGMIAESQYAASVIVKVAAGERWDDFVAYTVRNGWAGVECLSGIPGSTGATPMQNVGAYGQEVSETIVRVEALERATGRVRWFTSDECGFGYRTSVFKQEEKDRWIIASVTFRLRPDGNATVSYPELRQYLEERGASETNLAEVRAAVLAVRARKGMVLDPNDSDTRSDGSFFTNPIVSSRDFALLQARAITVAGDDMRMPSFPAADGNVKLSAAWLIEQAGFRKGQIAGRVGLSSKHALAIVNRGGGTAAEVLALAGEIQAKVRELFGIELQPEPTYIGF